MVGVHAKRLPLMPTHRCEARAVSKRLGKLYFHSITNWPHCAWARCHHYETESTLRNNRAGFHTGFEVRGGKLDPLRL